MTLEETADMNRHTPECWYGPPLCHGPYFCSVNMYKLFSWVTLGNVLFVVFQEKAQTANNMKTCATFNESQNSGD